jgi:hypothetical protein
MVIFLPTPDTNAYRVSHKSVKEIAPQIKTEQIPLHMAFKILRLGKKNLERIGV